MGQPTATIRTTTIATTISDATADAARRCIDRHIADLPDRVTVAQALGLLPDVGRARNTSRERGVVVEREVLA